MASTILLVLLTLTYLSTIAYTSTPPANIALVQPSETLGPINASIPKNVTSLNNTLDSITFLIPGTKIKLVFSIFSSLVSQVELDLCVIEGISSILDKTLIKGKDAILPVGSVEYKYGNVVINVYDFSAPAFRMTYASVASTLRGIALFTSLFGYYGVAFEVYNEKGHVGTGEFGQIIPYPQQPKSSEVAH